MEDANYISIIQMNGAGTLHRDRYGLLMTKTDEGIWMIHGFQTETDGIRYYEDGYNKAHAISYEGSMSACINYMFFRPSIVNMSLEAIESMVDEQVVHTMRNVAGTCHFLPLIHAVADVRWNAGTKPRLI